MTTNSSFQTRFGGNHLEMVSSFFFWPSFWALSLICWSADIMPLMSLQIPPSNSESQISINQKKKKGSKSFFFKLRKIELKRTRRDRDRGRNRDPDPWRIASPDPSRRAPARPCASCWYSAWRRTFSRFRGTVSEASAIEIWRERVVFGIRSSGFELLKDGFGSRFLSSLSRGVDSQEGEFWSAFRALFKFEIFDVVYAWTMSFSTMICRPPPNTSLIQEGDPKRRVEFFLFFEFSVV